MQEIDVYQIPNCIFYDILAAFFKGNALNQNYMEIPAAPKLLFLTTTAAYFCSHRLPLALFAKKQGFEIAVAAAADANSNHIIEQHGFRFFKLQHLHRSSLKPLTELRAVQEIIKIYKSFKPDIVHQVALKPVVYGTIAAKSTKVPFIVNALAGLGFVFSSNAAKAKILKPIVKFSLRKVANFSSATILQNPDDAAVLTNIGVDINKIKIIKGSGVDINYFKPSIKPQNNVLKFAFVARMLKDKGVEELVAAAKILQKQSFPVEIYLIGPIDKGNPTAVSEKQLLAWQQQQIITWTGFLTDVRQVWQWADVAILPSYREGLPKALLEAAACGVPMIATDVPGCREIVVNNKTGILVKPQNVDDIVAAIKKISQDNELRISLGENARDFVCSNFANNIIFTQTMNLYKEILGQDSNFSMSYKTSAC